MPDLNCERLIICLCGGCSLPTFFFFFYKARTVLRASATETETSSRRFGRIVRSERTDLARLIGVVISWHFTDELIMRFQSFKWRNCAVSMTSGVHLGCIIGKKTLSVNVPAIQLTLASQCSVRCCPANAILPAHHALWMGMGMGWIQSHPVDWSSAFTCGSIGK